MATRLCPHCGSQNISYQREQTANIGGSLHSFGGGKTGHSIFYWICIGWWWIPFKCMMKYILAISTMGLSLIFTRKKKDKIAGKTITANKTINHTVAVCQNCGYTWKI